MSTGTTSVDDPVYEVRAMSLAEILDTSFQLIKNAFMLLGGLAAIVYLPVSLVMGVITVGMDLENVEPEQMQQMLPALGGLFALYFIVLFVGFPFVVGAITGVAGSLFLGREVTFGEAVRMGLERFLPLLWAYFLFGLLMMLGLTALALAAGVVGAVFGLALGQAASTLAIVLLVFLTFWGYFYVLPVMALLPQVVVLEGLAGMEAIRRAWALSGGVKLRIIGIMITAYLLIFIPISGLQMMMNVIPILGGLAWGIAQAVGFAFTSSAQVVLYFDIRCRKEAFDLEHLARLVEERGERPAPIA